VNGLGGSESPGRGWRPSPESRFEGAQKCVQNLKRYHRPILCTEFMARPRGSRFDPMPGYFMSRTSARIDAGNPDAALI
jgi:hypothetical protein